MSRTSRVPELAHVILFVARDCPRSARARSMLEATGAPFEVRELEAAPSPSVPQAGPPTAAELLAFAAWLKGGMRALARTTEPRFAELGLEGAPDDCIAAALAAEPGLVARPFAVAPAKKRAIVPRPPERVAELFVPELPEGTDPGDLMRSMLRSRGAFG